MQSVISSIHNRLPLKVPFFWDCRTNTFNTLKKTWVPPTGVKPCLTFWLLYSWDTIPLHSNYRRLVENRPYLHFSLAHFLLKYSSGTVARQWLIPLCFGLSDFLFKCKLTAMRSLQYCCLLIPVKNRELLQVLLKFMVRLLDNHAILLSNDLPTKEMVSV